MENYLCTAEAKYTDVIIKKQICNCIDNERYF